MPEVVVFGISTGFPELSRSEGQIAHVLLTRSPLVYSRRSLTARLACVKHAASVRPEPGSNSPLKSIKQTTTQPPQKREGQSSVRQYSRESQQEPPTHTKKAQASGLLKGIINKTPDQPQKAGPTPCRLALQINSSTFGTLLSSQGSSAHRAQPSGRAAGLVKLTGNDRASQTRCSPRSTRATLIESCPERRSCCRTSSMEVTAGGGVASGPDTRPSGLASRRSLATEETLARPRRSVESRRCVAGHRRPEPSRPVSELRRAGRAAPCPPRRSRPASALPRAPAPPPRASRAPRRGLLPPARRAGAGPGRPRGPPAPGR
jgi:hypothetical protein